MRVMTYNIYDGGLDDGSPARRECITRVIVSARPDVLVLCECNDFDRDDRAALRALERQTGMSGRLMTVDSGYHLALLVRDLPIASFEEHREGFRHGAFRAQLQTDQGELTVIGTHLCPFEAATRRDEARRLVDLSSDRSVLLGDLNALAASDLPHYSPNQWPERYLRRHQGDETHPSLDTGAVALLEAAGLVDLQRRAEPGRWRATRPTSLLADRPRQRLDYILATPPVAAHLSQFDVIDHDDAQRASDHLPLVATFRD
jgi:endonuclease/exonuclease/phosphatase family metal-dependent hydrolase